MPRRGVPQTAHDALRRLLLAKIQRRLRKKCLPVHIVHIVCENFAGACAHPFEIAVMTKTRGRPQPFSLIRRFRRAQFFVHIVLRRSRVIYFYIIPHSGYVSLNSPFASLVLVNRTHYNKILRAREISSLPCKIRAEILLQFADFRIII